MYLVSLSALLPRRALADALSRLPSPHVLGPNAQLGILLSDAGQARPGRVAEIVRRVGAASGWTVPVMLECREEDVQVESGYVGESDRNGKCFDNVHRAVEMCRDEVSGVVLWGASVRVSAGEAGSGSSPKATPRPPWGPAHRPLLRLLRFLQSESALRTSFLSVDVTATRGAVFHPSVERYRLRWSAERGFLAAKIRGIDGVTGGLPTKDEVVVHDADVFEWCTDKTVALVRKRAEAVWWTLTSSEHGLNTNYDRASVVKARTAVARWFPAAAQLLVRGDEAGANCVVAPVISTGPNWVDLEETAGRVRDGFMMSPMNEIGTGVLQLHSKCQPDFGALDAVASATTTSPMSYASAGVGKGDV
ncbi:hypothetical protein HDU93_004799, partial [Gonapodya sp. JEL0774]